jgi:hypothetical protein
MVLRRAQGAIPGGHERGRAGAAKAPVDLLIDSCKHHTMGCLCFAVALQALGFVVGIVPRDAHGRSWPAT